MDRDGKGGEHKNHHSQENNILQFSNSHKAATTVLGEGLHYIFYTNFLWRVLLGSIGIYFVRDDTGGKNKMNKNSIIKEIIGNVLMPEGFTYLDKKNDGVEFIRKIKNSKQEMITQLVSFYEDEVKNKMYMDIQSSAAGHTFYRMPKIVPGCTDDVFRYSNDEEYVEAIINYADVLQKLE